MYYVYYIEKTKYTMKFNEIGSGHNMEQAENIKKLFIKKSGASPATVQIRETRVLI